MNPESQILLHPSAKTCDLDFFFFISVLLCWPLTLENVILSIFCIAVEAL